MLNNSVVYAGAVAVIAARDTRRLADYGLQPARGSDRIAWCVHCRRQWSRRAMARDVLRVSIAHRLHRRGTSDMKTIDAAVGRQFLEIPREQLDKAAGGYASGQAQSRADVPPDPYRGGVPPIQPMPKLTECPEQALQHL